MIEKITLTDFRNHKNSKIILSGAKNVIITGLNGSGKTAILEAVSLLGGDKGMRSCPMSDIVRFDSNIGFSVFSELSDDTAVSVSYAKDDTNRRAKIDGDNAPLSSLGNLLRIVWLTPKEDRLFIDSVSDRRAFFDRLVANFDAAHSGRVSRLSKLLSERAFALKNNADNNLISVYETQISSTAIAIAAARLTYAGEINYFLKTCAVSVDGMVEKLLMNKSAATAEKEYLEYLSQNRTLIGDKMICDGAHKSDFGLFNKTLNLPVKLTSTGQQKSVLIDLILAHCKLIKVKTGKTPVVLLDEAIAHLDLNARMHVFSELAAADAQVWATGIDKSAFLGIENVAFVSCVDGTINSIIE